MQPVTNRGTSRRASQSDREIRRGVHAPKPALYVGRAPIGPDSYSDDVRKSPLSSGNLEDNSGGTRMACDPVIRSQLLGPRPVARRRASVPGIPGSKGLSGVSEVRMGLQSASPPR